MVTLDDEAIEDILKEVHDILNKLKENKVDTFSISIDCDNAYHISISGDGSHTYESYVSTMR